MIGFPVVFPVLAILLLAALCWLLFGAGRRDFRWIAPPPAPDEARGQAMRNTIFIPTPSGDRIEAWLYRPAGPPAPVILMAPGLCGTKEGPLERFAEGFADAGYAVLAFDFRSFGGSEGRLRHSIDLRAHVADYRAAIAHVRAGNISGLDASRVILWGTSFSGASATCAAAADPVDAVILHVPYLGRPGSQPGLVQMIGYIGLAFGEIAGNAIAGLIGVKLPPAYITAYCRPGERAFAPSRDCISRRGEQGLHPFWKTVPHTYRGGWRNLMLVRDLQHLEAIKPEAALQDLRCPILLLAARKDDMIAIGDTRQIASRAPFARLTEIDAGHFDPYVDPYFAPNLATQIDFLREALPQTKTGAA
ncbi:MAG: alpha/beta fold hydrolase [Hyphomonadaceae bacterium]